MSGMANKCWRIVARVLGLLSAVLAAGSCMGHGWWDGINEGKVRLLYGVMPVELPVSDVGYQPPSPVHTGAVTVFTAQLPQGEITHVEADVNAAGRISQSIPMLDDGLAPDQTAGDRTFTGQLVWKAEYGTGEVDVRFDAFGTMDGMFASAQKQLPTLTVLP